MNEIYSNAEIDIVKREVSLMSNEELVALFNHMDCLFTELIYTSEEALIKNTGSTLDVLILEARLREIDLSLLPVVTPYSDLNSY